MGVHKFTACRYCADQIDVQYLVRHEVKCKTHTPEEREESKRTRSAAREAYRASVRIPVGTTKKAARSGEVIRRGTATCRYCHDEIGMGQMSKHEPVCQKRTPAHRAEAKAQRVRQREYNRSNYQNSLEVVAKRGVGRPSHHSVWGNGNGKRLSATISIDFKSFREMLLQLAPMLSIDKVEVL